MSSKNNIDILIAEKFNELIKKKYKTVMECSEKNFQSKKLLTNTISKIRQGEYPSITRIKEIAAVCDCEFTEFFKI